MRVKELSKEFEMFRSDISEHIKHIQHKFISTSGECEIDIKRPEKPVITLEERQIIINNFSKINDNIKKLDEYTKFLNSNYKYFVEDLYKQITELKEQREIFQHNFQYIGVIETVIEREETEWDGKTHLNMLVQLEGMKEVYNILCAKYKNPKVGDKITFIFNADKNKLMEIRKL